MAEWLGSVISMAMPREMSTVGAIEPPPGITPNFKNPTSRSGQLLAANLACLIIASVFVTLRAYTHISLVRSVGWDDCKQCFRFFATGLSRR